MSYLLGRGGREFQDRRARREAFRRRGSARPTGWQGLTLFGVLRNLKQKFADVSDTAGNVDDIAGGEAFLVSA